MKLKYIIGSAVAALLCSGLPSCTNLDETVYDQVMTENYYQNRQDIINVVEHPFEHLFQCVYIRHRAEECPADQLITPYRDSWYNDQGVWAQFHRHQYDDINKDHWTNGWTGYYRGVTECNLYLDDMNALDPEDFKMTQEEWDALKYQLTCCRAYAYINLFNLFRNVILTTTSNPEINAMPENRKQAEPKVMFDFLEKELLDCIEKLPVKIGAAGNNQQQGQCTKAFAAGLLVRLYLNAEVWIGEARWTECEKMCQRIIDGEFGSYSIDPNWYGPFDWNNETSPEVIYAFPASLGTVRWHMRQDYRTIYGRSAPYGSANYLDIEGDGERNPQYALSPSYDNSKPRKLFDYKLGMVSQKFLKYPGDIRYKQYKNTSSNTREGMFFLEGKVPNAKIDGGYAKDPFNNYAYYILDQVGCFHGNAEAGIVDPSKAASVHENGDFNSGLWCLKYPLYPYNGGYFSESDYVEMRLAEIVYALAECKLRLGKASEAGKLLNSVRSRNYTDFNSSIAYQPEGTVVLDEAELLDEWGREFIFESRRRTDLIRFGRFQEAWWDKPADKDDHYEIYPLSQSVLQQNLYLKQNPGYPDITR